MTVEPVLKFIQDSPLPILLFTFGVVLILIFFINRIVGIVEVRDDARWVSLILGTFLVIYSIHALSVSKESAGASDGTASPESGGTASPAVASEKSAVESAIRGHYEAIGANNFVEAYSYFGPTYRNQMDQQSWVSSEKSNQITGATINSLKVNNVSGNQATATVYVSFQDKTGTPRFLITWHLVKEDGQWKLDNQVSWQKDQLGRSIVLATGFLAYVSRACVITIEPACNTRTART